MDNEIKVILIRYGEIILKGLNRPVFESKLVENIKRAIISLGVIKVQKSQGRIFIIPSQSGYDYDTAILKLKHVFGIVSLSIVTKIPSVLEKINETAVVMAQNKSIDFRAIKGKRPVTFKVETKRGDKGFPLTSPEMSAAAGAAILSAVPGLRVDVKTPDFTLYIEVRESTYIYTDMIKATGGLPSGTGGRILLLLSGGIDSPVAGWMMGKRGVELHAVHFYSYPYTSERAKEKVIKLTKILSGYFYSIVLYIVPFTKIQLEINDKCPKDEGTIIMRRVMMRISEVIAKKAGAQALVTGESLGQVASQTIQSLSVTNASVSLPVFRPLIGMDKNEVIELARKIGTFETSILPYEDCCTVFVAKHPVTKPQLSRIMQSESLLQIDDYILEALNSTEELQITPNHETTW